MINIFRNWPKFFGSPAFASVALIAIFFALISLILFALDHFAFYLRGGGYETTFVLLAAVGELASAIVALKIVSRIFPLPKVILTTNVRTGIVQSLAGIGIGFAVTLLQIMPLLHIVNVSEAIASVTHRAVEFPWLFATAYFLPTAIAEEFVFRLGIFRIIQAKYGSMVAFWISSLSFNLTHSLITQSSPDDYFSDLFREGFLFAAAYWLTGRLFLPVGIHFAHNLVALFFLGKSLGMRPLDVPFIDRDSGLSETVTRFAIYLILPLLTAAIMVTLARVRERRLLNEKVSHDLMSVTSPEWDLTR